MKVNFVICIWDFLLLNFGNLWNFLPNFYEAVAAIFIAQLRNVGLSFGQLVAVR